MPRDPWCSDLPALSLVVLLAVTPAACKSLPVSPTKAGDDVVVTSSQLGGQGAYLTVGQTLAVPRPADFSDWQVDYSTDVLQPLTPADRMRSPGTEGWRFKAIGSGETDLALTPVMVVDPNTAAPPPAPPRFSVTIRVR